jgi:hypothetical protein
MNGQDPLESYSQPALIDLISQQAAILEETQAKAEHFERLYLDIIHSTSWKLAWPIRRAIQVLSWLRWKIKGRSGPTVMKQTLEGQKDGFGPGQPATSANHDFTSQLSDLAYFTSPSLDERLNVLITCHHDHDDLQALLISAANEAAQRQADLRILSLDPALTAKACLEGLTAPTSAASNPLPPLQFHRVEPTSGPRNRFRVDFGRAEHLITDSSAGLTFAKDILPAGQCRLKVLQPNRDRRGEGLQ